MAQNRLQNVMVIFIMRKIFRAILLIVLATALLTSILFLVYEYKQTAPPPQPVPVDDSSAKSEEPSFPTEREKPDLHIQHFPIDKYGPDEERENYQSGDMLLIIPKLNLNLPVLSDPDLSIVNDGVSQETLNQGVGLFKQAQLPGPENRNVSIAGHRDIYGKEFYYIDTLEKDDFIYLIYQGKRYTYEFEEQFITTPDDWDPISIKDYSRITLQSCTPINVASHRIFITGRLIDIEEIDDFSSTPYH